MQVLAVLLALAGAACLYLAAPNQVLTRAAPIRPHLSCWLGLGLTLASAWTMSVPEGWPVAIASTLVTMTCCLSVWPFIGTWMQKRRSATRLTVAERNTP
ncbi:MULTISPECIES: hypothetical protein [Cupriavidus]|jgi:hypothetical protein|uniref:DUF3325 domain-containing protein n=1 Tax=Cupriavidus metallidurans TaxID=119219 RepID=A0A482IRG6_9BURK|nr:MULTISPECIES: hypothetical protein [Cupriavidus]KWR78938.1 hypothetical protein RN01_22050 [Cupriavidus sp. SHE]QBP09470.1 hypothetical protein DDF84_006720 [Cupriavidus metallidurans]QGS30766.1 hypothetical protein FOB83_18855 [Cupriavidus metallidurans]QWC89822.1 hypothetical protein KB891_06415 [Cupriavidus metallidurans]